MKHLSSALLGACMGLLAVSTAQAANEDSGGAPPLRSGMPAADAPAGDFGVLRSYFTAVEASALTPYQDGFIPLRNASGTGIYCSGSSTDSRAAAQFQLPHGASLQFLRVWGVDTTASDMTVSMDELCLPDFDPGQPTVTAKGSVTSSGNAGFYSLLAFPSGTVDNQSCTYRLIVQFNASSSASCTGGSVLAFYKARVQWQRQISPGPAVATFTDVPVGSQFFAEVEALVRSGITAGTTATTFSPNNTVTRLQMAAFLARALGLQYDTIVDPANP